MRKSFFSAPLLAAVLLSFALVSCGDGKSPAPTSTGATQTVEPTPESTVEAEDLAQAERLYSEGAVEEATAIYTRVISRGNDGERRQALWALARLHYQEGDNGAAKDTVEVYLGEDITPDAERLALLLKGRLYAAQGDNDEAEKALTAYVSAGGPAAPYARLQLAELAAQRGDIARATEQTNQTLLEGLPAGITTDARFSLAGYFWDSGDIASAIALYELLGVEAETRADRGEALWLAATLAHDAGDPARALRSLSTLLAAYPWHDRALQALDDPRFGPNIALGSRALVLFNHRVNADAASAYQTIVDGADPALAADAQYHLGILAERFENYEQALAHYDASIVAASASQQVAMLGQALWDKGLVFELLGRSDEAVETYVSIADVAPSSEHTAEALFRAGILRFKQGRPAEAAAIWGRQRGLAADEESQARAYFWAAKASEAAGDQAAAERDFGLGAALPGADYYTLRARALMSPKEFPSGELPEGDPDWTVIEEWLRTQYGPEDTAARTTFFASPAYVRTIELLEAGLRAEAEVEFEQLVTDASGNAWLVYRLTRDASDEGLYSIAARAAAGFAGPASGAPPQVMAMAYPLVYPNIVSEQASRNDVSPYLLLALVRQESFYDARAVSPADATGLTQVIPTTAEGIADELGEENFRNAHLKRPNVSLRFGAYYLGAQIELLEGDIPAALAAYNGGPGNAFRWQEAAGASDPDIFLETIDYEETRAYVELVLENYAVYLYAYGLTDEPSLPLD
jgi:soluble lytic murein transglycosylase